MVDTKESILVGYPNTISYESSKKIIEQMEKNICKIKIGNEQGTGFFCKIPFPDMNNMLSVLITNNHVINEKILNIKDYNIEIDIKIENNIKKLNLNNRIKYTNKEYDITIIEIKKNEIMTLTMKLRRHFANKFMKKKLKNYILIKYYFYLSNNTIIFSL